MLPKPVRREIWLWAEVAVWVLACLGWMVLIYFLLAS